MLYVALMVLMIVLTVGGLVANLFGNFMLGGFLLSAPAGWAAGACFGELSYHFSK
jgi:hypothetical protein